MQGLQAVQDRAVQPLPGRNLQRNSACSRIAPELLHPRGGLLLQNPPERDHGGRCPHRTTGRGRPQLSYCRSPVGINRSGAGSRSNRNGHRPGGESHGRRQDLRGRSRPKQAGPGQATRRRRNLPRQ
uniref:(northern house mosquito) hypothetical protein n=1 Tax=Culex pipiens TaxID=7175 RepID=A0A8D8FP83_CULPI